jgi:NAD(P)-dependent dehydrogenase (short-subunit alcohol dehydrogenase family)
MPRRRSKVVLVPGDIQNADHCRKIVDKAVAVLGGIDILVNNAAHPASFKDIGDISDEEWELTFKVNIHAMFYLTKAAVPHMKPGSAIMGPGREGGRPGVRRGGRARPCDCRTTSSSTAI